jgi:uncharacterized phage protein (TIGR01671 family)
MNKRVIKFRAWDKENKKMFEVDRMCFLGSYEYSGKSYDENEAYTVGPGDNGEQEIGNCSNIIMQYTGIKDKNGKEIYEGDIIKNDIDDVGVMKFFECEFLAMDMGNHCYNVAIGEIEIIGNVYENKNLIK